MPRLRAERGETSRIDPVEIASRQFLRGLHTWGVVANYEVIVLATHFLMKKCS